MRVVGLGTLDEFKLAHPDSSAALRTWLAMTRQAEWRMPSDVTSAFPLVSGLSDCRFVFNIRGNHYRLLVQIAFKTGVVGILRIGTHLEYDTWGL
jgi:mRNA interferase HigB